MLLFTEFPLSVVVHISQWKFENETKLSISMAWIGKRPTGEASVRIFFFFKFRLHVEIYLIRAVRM